MLHKFGNKELAKLRLVAWLASLAGQFKFGSVSISPAIWALVFGVIFCAVEFLDTNLLNRANSYWITMFSLMMAVFDGLTALYGFPADAIISESTCNALSDDPDEVNYLMSKIFPSMIV